MEETDIDDVSGRTPSDSETSNFLGLPFELRTKVYRYNLNEGTGHVVLQGARRRLCYSNGPPKVHHTLRHAQIMRVCKQIRDETRPIFYHEPTFAVVLQCSATGWRTLRSIVYSNASLIRKVDIVLNLDSYDSHPRPGGRGLLPPYGKSLLDPKDFKRLDGLEKIKLTFVLFKGNDPKELVVLKDASWRFT